MIIKHVLLIITVLFFAMNMGASGIAPSFAAVYCGKLIRRKWAVLLFSVFVIIGALMVGGRVAKTLSSCLLAAQYFSFDVALIILIGAAVSLFFANMLRVPQSTSWVTVFAIVGASLYFNSLNIATVTRMVSLWLALPLAGFVITLLLFKIIYPPRLSNMWFYEKVHLWKKQIHFLSLAASCYIAFAIGANNVANAVAPLTGAGLINSFFGLLLIAPLFGLGGWLVGDKTMKTIGKELVPLGLITSTLVAFVTASLLLVASLLGFPQSLVQLNAFSILAVGTIKHEHVLAISQKATRKTFLVWLAAPIAALFITYIMLKVFIGG